MINPGEVHTGNAATERGWVYRTLYPSVAKLQRAARAVCQTRLVAPYFPQAVVYDVELAARIRRYHLRSERGSGLALEEAFVELTALLVARYTGVPPTPREPGQEPRAVRLTRDYLKANLQTELTLTELGTLTGLSPYALLRAFRRLTGLTPHEYGLVRRIDAAKKRLKRGEKVAAVAADLGFYDQSHFGRHFRRVVGVTPGVYAKGAILS